jgi:6-phosphofructokinase 1
MSCVTQTQQVAAAIKAKDYEKAMSLRGSSFKVTLGVFYPLVRVFPHPPAPDQKRLRLAVLHAGGPAPGMNTAVRAIVRFGIDKGHTLLGVQNGFRGLIKGDIQEMEWMDVSGWVSRGGAELGASRKIPEGGDLYAIARQIEDHNIQGLLIIGGWAGYQAAYNLYHKRNEFPSFNIPIICLPASINNNLPGSEYSVGADTALNSIAEAVDKIKQSAVASRRCFIVEVRGRYCGYLALMSGLATGAERVYLHEEGVSLQDLQADLNYLTQGFQQGKRLGLIIRNEYVNPLYTTEFMRSLFDQEGGELFDVRQAILGHQQQGGNPSPFDRIQATRLAVRCIEFLIEEAGKTNPRGTCVGLQAGQVRYTDLEDLPRLMDQKLQRPKEQWWLKLRPIAKLLAQPGPQFGG